MIIMWRIDPNDKLCKCIFNLDDNTISSRCFQIIERHDTKKAEKLTTLVRFTSDSISKLSAYDREVAFACFSLFENHIPCTSIEQIYRTMIGSTKSRSTSSSEVMISNSLQKLVSTYIAVEISSLKKMGYCVDANSLNGQILPAKVTTSNRHLKIEFLNESILMTIAKIKNSQLITYPLEWLAVGGGNSPERLTIRNYTLRRILECRLHPQLTSTVTFKDIFEKQGLNNKGKCKKKRYRDYLLQCFGDWKKYSLITNFRLICEVTGIHGINFSTK